MLPLALAAGLLLATPAPDVGLAADEHAILFPTNAHPVDGGWEATLHAWVHEPEHDSLWRRAALRSTAAALGLDESCAERALFRSRVAPLIADSESGKQLVVEGPGARWTLPETGGNGHASRRVLVPGVREEPEAGGARTVLVSTLPSRRNPRVFTGRVQLVPARGLSVVSDIDDTIKVSEVLDRSRLLERTFLEPFEPVAGMAEAYADWAGGGAAFHYVSSSPWGLFGALDAFLGEHGFPHGSVHLRHARIKDGSAFSLLASSDAHKTERILALVDRWPRRRFLLVGDAGERDPEIYGGIARRRPGRVAAVLIRRVQGADVSPERLRRALRGVPEDRWRLFDDGRELLEVPIGEGR